MCPMINRKKKSRKDQTCTGYLQLFQLGQKKHKLSLNQNLKNPKQNYHSLNDHHATSNLNTYRKNQTYKIKKSYYSPYATVLPIKNNDKNDLKQNLYQKIETEILSYEKDQRVDALLNQIYEKESSFVISPNEHTAEHNWKINHNKYFSPDYTYQYLQTKNENTNEQKLEILIQNQSQRNLLTNELIFSNVVNEELNQKIENSGKNIQIDNETITKLKSSKSVIKDDLSFTTPITAKRSGNVHEISQTVLQPRITKSQQDIVVSLESPSLADPSDTLFYFSSEELSSQCNHINKVEDKKSTVVYSHLSTQPKNSSESEIIVTDCTVSEKPCIANTEVSEEVNLHTEDVPSLLEKKSQQNEIQFGKDSHSTVHVTCFQNSTNSSEHDRNHSFEDETSHLLTSLNNDNLVWNSCVGEPCFQNKNTELNSSFTEQTSNLSKSRLTESKIDVPHSESKSNLGSCHHNGHSSSDLKSQSKSQAQNKIGLYSKNLSRSSCQSKSDYKRSFSSFESNRNAFLKAKNKLPPQGKSPLRNDNHISDYTPILQSENKMLPSKGKPNEAERMQKFQSEVFSWGRNSSVLGQTKNIYQDEICMIKNVESSNVSDNHLSRTDCHSLCSDIKYDQFSGTITSQTFLNSGSKDMILSLEDKDENLQYSDTRSENLQSLLQASNKDSFIKSGDPNIRNSFESESFLNMYGENMLHGKDQTILNSRKTIEEECSISNSTHDQIFSSIDDQNTNETNYNSKQYDRCLENVLNENTSINSLQSKNPSFVNCALKQSNISLTNINTITSSSIDNIRELNRNKSLQKKIDVKKSGILPFNENTSSSDRSINNQTKGTSHSSSGKLERISKLPIPISRTILKSNSTDKNSVQTFRSPSVNNKLDVKQKKEDALNITTNIYQNECYSDMKIKSSEQKQKSTTCVNKDCLSSPSDYSHGLDLNKNFISKNSQQHEISRMNAKDRKNFFEMVTMKLNDYKKQGNLKPFCAQNELNLDYSEMKMPFECKTFPSEDIFSVKQSSSLPRQIKTPPEFTFKNTDLLTLEILQPRRRRQIPSHTIKQEGYQVKVESSSKLISNDSSLQSIDVEKKFQMSSKISQPISEVANAKFIRGNLSSCNCNTESASINCADKISDNKLLLGKVENYKFLDEVKQNSFPLNERPCQDVLQEFINGGTLATDKDFNDNNCFFLKSSNSNVLVHSFSEILALNKDISLHAPDTSFQRKILINETDNSVHDETPEINSAFIDYFENSPGKKISYADSLLSLISTDSFTKPENILNDSNNQSNSKIIQESRKENYSIVDSLTDVHFNPSQNIDSLETTSPYEEYNNEDFFIQNYLSPAKENSYFSNTNSCLKDLKICEELSLKAQKPEINENLTGIFKKHNLFNLSSKEPSFIPKVVNNVYSISSEKKNLQSDDSLNKSSSSIEQINNIKNTFLTSYNSSPIKCNSQKFQNNSGPFSLEKTTIITNKNKEKNIFKYSNVNQPIAIDPVSAAARKKIEQTNQNTKQDKAVNISAKSSQHFESIQEKIYNVFSMKSMPTIESNLNEKTLHNITSLFSQDSLKNTNTNPITGNVSSSFTNITSCDTEDDNKKSHLNNKEMMFENSFQILKKYCDQTIFSKINKSYILKKKSLSVNDFFSLSDDESKDVNASDFSLNKSLTENDLFTKTAVHGNYAPKWKEMLDFKSDTSGNSFEEIEISITKVNDEKPPKNVVPSTVEVNKTNEIKSLHSEEKIVLHLNVNPNKSFEVSLNSNDCINNRTFTITEEDNEVSRLYKSLNKKNNYEEIIKSDIKNDRTIMGNIFLSKSYEDVNLSSNEVLFPDNAIIFSCIYKTFNNIANISNLKWDHFIEESPENSSILFQPIGVRNDVHLPESKKANVSNTEIKNYCQNITFYSSKENLSKHSVNTISHEDSLLSPQKLPLTLDITIKENESPENENYNGKCNSVTNTKSIKSGLSLVVSSAVNVIDAKSSDESEKEQHIFINDYKNNVPFNLYKLSGKGDSLQHSNSFTDCRNLLSSSSYIFKLSSARNKKSEGSTSDSDCCNDWLKRNSWKQVKHHSGDLHFASKLVENSSFKNVKQLTNKNLESLINYKVILEENFSLKDLVKKLEDTNLTLQTKWSKSATYAKKLQKDIKMFEWNIIKLSHQAAQVPVLRKKKLLLQKVIRHQRCLIAKLKENIKEMEALEKKNEASNKSSKSQEILLKLLQEKDEQLLNLGNIVSELQGSAEHCQQAIIDTERKYIVMVERALFQINILNDEIKDLSSGNIEDKSTVGLMKTVHRNSHLSFENAQLLEEIHCLQQKVTFLEAANISIAAELTTLQLAQGSNGTNSHQVIEENLCVT